MNRAGIITATTLALGLVGVVLGLIWGFFAQEAGWWGAWALFGLIVGPIVGVAVADRLRGVA